MSNQGYLRRKDAATYLKNKHGIGSWQTLAKLAISGDGPAYRKFGRTVLYAPSDLDQCNSSPWATTLENHFSYYSYALQRTNIARVDTIYSFSKSLDYIGTVRGRLGYLLTPELFIYATAGLSYGGTNLHSYAWQQVYSGLSNEVGPGKTDVSRTRLGWTAGGGLEWMFSNNWSTKVEYLYYDLGSPSIYMGQNTIFWSGSSRVSGISAGDIASAQGCNAQTRFNGNIVRAGVNYHFNLGLAPVVAKF